MAHGENPPLNITPGAIRFNTDSMKLEYFRIGMEGGNTSSYAGIGTVAAGEWVQLTTDSPDIQTGGTRGLIGGGGSPGGAYQDDIEFVTISTTGGGTDFGDLLTARQDLGALASSTRGLFCGGTDGSTKDEIEFVTISSVGNAIDFGNLSPARKEIATLSNETRGIIAGSGTNVISFVTIATIGNDVDFGDLPDTDTTACYGAASSTRGIIAGGDTVNTIRFITINTLGNAADFGDLTDSRYAAGSFSNSVRAVFGGGWSPNVTDVIDYITIATLGNAIDFGNLTQAKYLAAGCASPTRGLFCGGHRNPSPHVREIDYVEIMSKGDAVDFGDISHAVVAATGACSNGHGGLG